MDFSKLRVGTKTINNPILNLNSYEKVNANYGNKSFVLNAIYKHNYEQLREISRYFYESNGIYHKLCQYLAFLYRFDYYVAVYTTNVIDNTENKKKVSLDFSKALLYLEKSNAKRICNNISLDMIIEGVYYGILVDFGDKFAIQKLPSKYCRSRYYSGSLPIVELNLQFFDSYLSTPQQRIQVLKTFPKEIQLAYLKYKQGKLEGDYPGDKSCWFPLDPGTSIRMSLNDSDFPALVGVIPNLIDLDSAQELDRQKTMQQLLKIIVQKLPLDKNGDLIFDMDEAKDIHDNAVVMLKRAIGVDVLTTFADIIKIDTKDANSATTRDDLEKVERTVFNSAGISHNMLNADGNTAVTSSILADESSVRDIPLQFSILLTRIVEKFNKKNHYDFIVTVLETTQFNYKEISKMYKEQTQLGFSKMLPQIALGHSQASILATLTFENKVLNLAEIMVPPMMSSTMSNKAMQIMTGKNTGTEQKQVGRPEKDDTQKSDKTLQNRESMG